MLYPVLPVNVVEVKPASLSVLVLRRGRSIYRERIKDLSFTALRETCLFLAEEHKLMDRWNSVLNKVEMFCNSFILYLVL